MTWSYSGDPSASDKDAVRFLVGDTDPEDPLVQDAEIVYAISVGGSPEIAAAVTCESLAARFAREADVKQGSSSETASQRFSHYQDKANQLRLLATLDALPRFGGQYKSEKETFDSDTDAIQPNFRMGMADRPDASHRINSGSADEDDI